jgi:hypothetical protein
MFWPENFILRVYIIRVFNINDILLFREYIFSLWNNAILLLINFITKYIS